jgi:hypothetical protein
MIKTIGYIANQINYSHSTLSLPVAALQTKKLYYENGASLMEVIWNGICPTAFDCS